MISENNLIKFPFKVHFAGMDGTTQGMIRAGWELSLARHDGYSPYSRYSCTIFGRHVGLGLQMRSGMILMDDRVHFENFVAYGHAPILIESVAREIRVVVPKADQMVSNWDGSIGLDRNFFDNHMTHNSFGYDHRGLSTMSIATVALEHYGKFSSIKNDSDIFIPKEEIWTMEKHLDAIRKIQEPKQEEIRRRIMKEREHGEETSEIKTRIMLVS